MAPGPVDAAGTVDAQTAPTAPWKTLRVFHELPQGILSTKSSTDRLNHPQILGAAGKAAIQLVKVQSCQLPVSDM